MFSIVVVVVELALVMDDGAIEGASDMDDGAVEGACDESIVASSKLFTDTIVIAELMVLGSKLPVSI